MFKPNPYFAILRSMNPDAVLLRRIREAELAEREAQPFHIWPINRLSEADVAMLERSMRGGAHEFSYDDLYVDD